MIPIETIDLLSSDTDSSINEIVSNAEDRKQADASFVTKRMKQVAEEGSTILFEEEEMKKDMTVTPSKKRFPISPELLNRKRVKQTEEEVQLHERINASIPHKRSTFSGDSNESIPSALKELGVTEEEDKQNTSEVRHILNNFSNQKDLSLHNLLNSILSDADDSIEEQSKGLDEYPAHSLEFSEGDLSILHPHSLNNSQFSSVIVSESDDASMKRSGEIEILTLSSDSESEESIPAVQKRPVESISCISLSSESDSEESDRLRPDPLLMQIFSQQETEKVETAETAAKKDVDVVSLDEESEEESPPKPAEPIHNFDDFISNYVHGCSQRALSDDSTLSDSMSDVHNPEHGSKDENTLPKLADSPKSVENTLPKLADSPKSVKNTLPSLVDPPNSINSPKPTFPLTTPQIKSNTHSQKHKTLLVCFEEQLSRQEQGKKLIEAIRPSCIIGPTIHCPAHGLVLIMRQIEHEYVIIHDCLTMVMDGHAMISLIKEKGLEGGLNHIKQVRSLLLTSTTQHLYLILTNMQSIIAEQRRKRRQSILPFTKDFLTELYLRLRLDCSITCFPCESESAAAEWMMKIIQCVRDGPYLQPLTELGVVTKGKAIGTTYQDTLNEKELCLFRMLQCIPGVSTTKALAILHHYKSVAELVEAYELLPTEEMKEDLLSDKMGGTSKQRQLSKRIYESFICTNGNCEL